MTEEEFMKLLKDYDWWYSMSDDARVFCKGLLQTEIIQKACKDENLKKIYEKEKKKVQVC